MKFLGISAYYHDSAAALTIDGHIIAAVQEERFTRVKHDDSFPANAVKYCLEYAGLTIDQLDAVVFYDKPFIKFERLIETYYSYAPKGIISFLKAMPVWMREKLFLRNIIKDELEDVMEYDRKKLKILFPEHHLSHAASAFYPSPYQDAAILTIDGVGEWATASISHGRGQDITVLKELHFPDSVGLLYSAFTYYLGFKVNSGEYKLMGLAPYGINGSERVERFKKIIYEKLVTVSEDGSIRLDQRYFDYAVGLRMARDARWADLFGFKRRKKEDEQLSQEHCDLALAIQQVTEDIVLKMAAEAKRLTGSENICLAGGVALNCVANGKLLKEGIFKNIWVQPAAGDAGGALGAALAAEYIYACTQRTTDEQHDAMNGAYLGPSYADNDILATISKYKAVSSHYASDEDLCTAIAELIAMGSVVGWFQGRAEFGPRALGNRTILADPRNAEMQQRLNLKIKYREGFRPFAPSVLVEDAAQYFELDRESPYMLLVADIKDAIRKPVSADYESKPMMERLYTERSELQSITHVDFSARVQTVSRDTNPLYHQLLNAFKDRTGCGVLINTSFNVRGEPPVLTPEDALICFMHTEMDILVMGRYVLLKQEQNDITHLLPKKQFKLD